MRTNIDLIVKKHGGFFAFNDKQLEQQKDKNVIYMSMGGGLVLPEHNAIDFMEEVEQDIKKSVKLDFADNSKKDIIWRELANHEAQISMDISSTADSLVEHNITHKNIENEFDEYMNHCTKHNIF